MNKWILKSNLKKKAEEEIKHTQNGQEETFVYDVNFSDEEQSKRMLEKYKQDGINAFNNFLNNNTEGYLCFTIRQTDTHYKNYYALYVDILYNYGGYTTVENGGYEKTPRYHISVTVPGGPVYGPQEIMSRTFSNKQTVYKYIQMAFDKGLQYV